MFSLFYQEEKVKNTLFFITLRRALLDADRPKLTAALKVLWDKAKGKTKLKSNKKW